MARPDVLTAAADALLRLHLATGQADAPEARAAASAVAASGASRAEVLDTLALAYVHAGPFGMNAAARAWEQELAHLDREPGRGAVWPDGWAFDAAAMRSGIDVATLTLTPAEAGALRGWHERVQGEVPAYVDLLARRNPEGLKAMRVRLELAVTEALPRQLVPLCLLQLAVVRRAPDAARRYRRQAAVFGVAPALVVAVG